MRLKPTPIACMLALLVGCSAAVAGERETIDVLPMVQAEKAAGLYVFNRSPLEPSPLMKLPIGAITPKGWLRGMLELEKEGMTGRLKEISPWLEFQRSAWGNREGKGERGWEELPYWLKGFGDLGYALHDEAVIAEARQWIDVVLSSQREDGWFGPRDLLKSLDGKPDLWPHMVMLNVLQSFHEYTDDPRVIPFLTRYLEWENKLPPSAFGEGYWPKIRAGDNIESAFWLYNRTGHPWLLDLARKIHENMARWDTDVINWHNVNLAQGFRASAVYYMKSKEPRHLEAAERNYQKATGMYGQFAGGTFVADENARPGYVDPRGGIETCGIVEFMHSFEMLTKISGSPLWVDRCEEIAFNSFPASMSPDLKGLHYLTCANQVELDRNNKAPAVQNGGTMFSYSPFEVYRCCQHNVSHGWPYYAEELWLATWDGGLCASLYAASDVKAKVGDGTTVTIAEETQYPFEETVQLKVSLPRPTSFPLYLRVPRWCGEAGLRLNGRPLEVKAKPLSYIVLRRTWNDGDAVVLELPMKVSLRTWKKNKDSVSVDHGPLSYSLKIGEKWRSYGQNTKWPEWEVLPTTPWNYGLVLADGDPVKFFEVVRKKGPLAKQPFTPETVPVEIRTKAKRIPAWQQDRQGMVGLLQQSPVKSGEPVETVTLIPMGAARLRVSSFPVIGSGPEANEWVGPAELKPCPYKASASHCWTADTLDALCDGTRPDSSNDQGIPRFTWWDHRGTSEWVQYDLDKARKVSGVEVYWFDDESTGGNCRLPASWEILYKEGDAWKPVKSPSVRGVDRDKFNATTFEAVEASGLRIEVKLKPGFSGGILEWKVK